MLHLIDSGDADNFSSQDVLSFFVIRRTSHVYYDSTEYNGQEKYEPNEAFNEID